jgi:hypothetical protein
MFLREQRCSEAGQLGSGDANCQSRVDVGKYIRGMTRDSTAGGQTHEQTSENSASRRSRASRPGPCATFSERTPCILRYPPLVLAAPARILTLSLPSLLSLPLSSSNPPPTVSVPSPTHPNLKSPTMVRQTPCPFPSPLGARLSVVASTC